MGSAVTEQREARVCEPPDSDCKVIVLEKLSDLRENTDRQASGMKRRGNKTERSTEKKKKVKQAEILELNDIII